MLIVDSLITKDHWEPIFSGIESCFCNGKYDRVSSEIYKMSFNRFDVTYLAYVAAVDIDNTMHVYGWLLLEKRWMAYEVAQSFVFKPFRGDGWGRLLYISAIEDDVLLASGNQQTKAGRNLWKGLVKSDRFHIWAHDFKDLDRVADVVYDEDDDALWSTLKIYEKYKRPRKKQTEDIRLLAMRKI